MVLQGAGSECAAQSVLYFLSQTYRICSLSETHVIDHATLEAHLVSLFDVAAAAATTAFSSSHAQPTTDCLTGSQLKVFSRLHALSGRGSSDSTSFEVSAQDQASTGCKPRKQRATRPITRIR